MWLISVHACQAKGYVIVQVNVQAYADTCIKLDDCDKHVQTVCKNDHSISKVLGHSDQTFNKPYFDL